MSSSLYSSKELRDISFEAFRHSQGTPDLQAQLIRYVAVTEPERIPRNEQGYCPLKIINPMVRQLSGRVQKYTASPMHTNSEEVARRFGADMALVNRAWNTGTLPAEERETARRDLIASIAAGIALGDYHYLVIQDGRPRGTNDAHTTPPNRAYLSHFVYYGLLGQTTKIPVFDDLYQRVVDYCGDSDHQAVTIDVNTKLRASRPTTQEKLLIEEKMVPLGQIITAAAQVHLEHYPYDA